MLGQALQLQVKGDEKQLFCYADRFGQMRAGREVYHKGVNSDSGFGLAIAKPWA